MGVTSLTTTPSDLLAKFLFPIPTTLYSTGLEVVVAKEGMLPSGNKDSIELGVKNATRPL